MRRRAELATIRKTVKKVQEIKKNQSVKIARVIPHNKYTALRKYMATQHTTFSDKIFPAGQQISDVQTKRHHKTRNTNVLNYLRQQRVNVDKLKKLNKETTQTMAQIMKRPPPRRNRKIIRILRANEIPDGIRRGRPNPWTIKIPPYDGGYWRYYGWVDGFLFIPTLYLNHASGFIGNINYLKDSSAGDSDWARVDYYTQLALWYKMPSAGILEVWVEGQPTECQHYCSLYDEWGWSNSSVYQYNYITLQVNNGSKRLSKKIKNT